MEGVQRVQEVDEAARGRLRAGEARARPLRAPRQGVPPRALQEGHRAAHAAQAPMPPTFPACGLFGEGVGWEYLTQGHTP